MEEESFGSRLKHAWNAFLNKDPTPYYNSPVETSYYRPDRPRFSRGNERSLVTAVYNRIAIDVASIDIKHVRLDENERFVETMKSGLNECLTLEANVDQTGRALIQDAVMSLMDEGCVAIVPVDTTFDPTITGGYDVNSLRVGKIVTWKPQSVVVRLYNEKTGKKEEVELPKKMVAIVENPLFAVMNEPNSTMQRLIRKLNLLDVVDEQTSAGKLDLIIQLPYVIKSDARRAQAEHRRKDIEEQLAGSKYGIAYTDGTEKITQLNRSLENNLLKQVEYLTEMLYAQLGITKTVLDGTADEKTMLNYHNRTIEPIISAIVDEMKRKFLTKTARSQLQSIEFFRDPFRLVPVNDIAEIADKFTRNEIMTSNEIRQVIGMKPSADPKADQLVNSNIAQPAGEEGMMSPEGDPNMMAPEGDPNMMAPEGDPNMMAPEGDPNMMVPEEAQPAEEQVAPEEPQAPQGIGAMNVSDLMPSGEEDTSTQEPQGIGAMKVSELAPSEEEETAPQEPQGIGAMKVSDLIQPEEEDSPQEPQGIGSMKVSDLMKKKR